MAYSGEGLITKVLVLYDTRSNILLLFKRNLAEMATPETFAGIDLQKSLMFSVLIVSCLCF